MEIDQAPDPEQKKSEHGARSNEEFRMDIEESEIHNRERNFKNGPLKCKTSISSYVNHCFLYDKSTSTTFKFCKLFIAAIEGWVIFITGIHEEAQEEDLYEAFADFGDVKNIHLNLDRRTGFVKGYALVEYARRDEAEAAIHNMNGKELLTKVINVDWAFSNGPHKNRGHETHM
jgi:hypothetical protein